jgi:hypothetical protein
MITEQQRGQAVKQCMADLGLERITAAEFLGWAATLDPTDPIFIHFCWDDAQAGHEWRLQQARRFIASVRIDYQVRLEEVSTSSRAAMRSAVIEIPMFMSPRRDRDHGGGYVTFQPRDDDHRREWCGQAADSLRAWSRRHEAALSFAGVDRRMLDVVLGRLDAAASDPDEAAAE